MTQLCELVDEYGPYLRADFQQFYNGLDLADVWRGGITRRRALELAEQLAFEPRSRYRAMILGGPEWIGQDRPVAVLMDLFDALQANTVVTAKTGGGKPKTPDEYPRPVVTKKSDPKVIQSPTIDDFPIGLVVALTTGSPAPTP